MAWRGFVAAAAFSLGILSADSIDTNASISVLIGSIGLAVLLFGWLGHRRRPSELRAGDLHPVLNIKAIGFILLGFVLCGFSAMGLREAARDRSLTPRLGGRVIDISGVVVSDPETRGEVTTFVVSARAIDGSRTRERVQVGEFGDPVSAQLGDTVAFTGRIRALELDEPYDRYLWRKAVVAKSTVLGGVRVSSPSKNPLIRVSNYMRRSLRETAVENLSNVDAGLVLGFTIGDRSLIPESIQDEFRASGLSHLTAVSGANVAMVLGAVLLVLHLVGLGKRSKIVVSFVCLLVFAVITRWEPSVLRATFMAAIAVGAFLYGRRSSPSHALGLTMTGLLALDPLLLWSVGFQLSFAATAGILIVSPLLVRRLRYLPKRFAEAASVTVSAQIGVTPVLALHFGTISGIAVVANLLAFPMVAPATLLGLSAGGVSLFWPGAAGLIMHAAGVPTGMIRWVAVQTARSSLATIEADGVELIVVAGLALLAVSLIFRSRSARLLFRLLAVVAVTISLATTGFSAGGAPPQALRATFFDVGQGDAALVESPGGARILIDGGPEESAIAKELRRRGISRLDLVVFSHAHIDHINGLGGVLAQFDVRAAIQPGVPSRSISTMKIPVPDSVRDGERFMIGDIIVDVLGPTSGQVAEAIAETLSVRSGEGSLLNDASVVLRISYGTDCILFTGDLEEAGQGRLLSEHSASLECAILKAPHHGSPRIDLEFIRAVDPEWVVISVGPYNYGHPSRGALNAFASTGARSLRTDLLGDIVVDLDRSGRVLVSE